MWLMVVNGITYGVLGVILSVVVIGLYRMGKRWRHGGETHCERR